MTQVTPQKKGKFLASLARSGNVAESARLIGVSRKTVYAWREADWAFGGDWDEAHDTYIDRLEAEADRRGVEGVVKPIFYLGQQVTEIRQYSDTLLIFRLKGERPKKYRDTPPPPQGISPQVLQVLIQKVLLYVNNDQAQELLDFVAAQIAPGPAS